MIEQLKSLIGGERPQEYYEFLLGAAKEKALAYCNISILPKELEHTVVLMAAALDDSNAEVTSVKEGDSQVGYAVRKESTWMRDFELALRRFRRVGTL